MKKTEITPGEEYVFAYRNDYRDNIGSMFERHFRVRVIGPAESAYIQGRTVSRVPVIWLDPQTGKPTEAGEGFAETRNIRELWAPFAEYVAETREWKRKAKIQRDNAQRERIAKAKQIVANLTRLGVEDETYQVLGEADAQRLADWGFHVRVAQEFADFSSYHIVAPLAGSVLPYILKGSAFQIPGDTLLALTTDQSPSAD